MRNQFLIVFFLLFINSTSSQNDSIKSLVEKSNDLNLDMWELTDYAREHLKEDIELARFFYYWIGNNIKYDNKLYQKFKTGNLIGKEFFNSQKDYNVYENRKGVCAGYANLFQWFMNEIDIETVVISGHIRDERNHYVELELDDNFRHAWNAIKLNGKWILVDTTWGTSNNFEVSDYYFDIKPELAIITHYPKENKWQLLDKPLSIEEFNNSKFIKPIWFFVGFTDIPKLKADQDNYYFIFHDNPNINWVVNLLYSIDNKKFNLIQEIEIINQDGYTYLRFDKKQMPERIFFKVNLNKEFTDLNYEDVINFKI